MNVKKTINGLADQPISYWPLDEPNGSTTVVDQKNLHDGTVNGNVILGALPFGSGTAPIFPGGSGDYIEVPDDDQYSLVVNGAYQYLTVLAFFCPLVLDYPNTDGTSHDLFVRALTKADPQQSGAHPEWQVRNYRKSSPHRPSRWSGYVYQDAQGTEGAGAYCQYNLNGDLIAVEQGKWTMFVVRYEQFSGTDPDNAHGVIARIYGGVNGGFTAPRSPADKYGAYGVTPFNGAGKVCIGGDGWRTGFLGGIAHVAIWQSSTGYLADADGDLIWSAAVTDLQSNTMYHQVD